MKSKVVARILLAHIVAISSNTCLSQRSTFRMCIHFSRTKVEVLEAFYNVLSESFEGGEASPTVEDWMHSFGNVAVQGSCSRPAFLTALNAFCDSTTRCKNLGELALTAEQAGLENASNFAEVAQKVLTVSLPEMAQLLDVAFRSTLILESQAYKSLNLGDKILPRSRDADWRQLGAVAEQSSSLFDSLTAIAKVLQKSDDLKGLVHLHLVNQLLLKACVAMWTLKETDLSEDTVVPAQQVEGMVRIIGCVNGILGQLTNVNDCPDADASVKNAMPGWLQFLMKEIVEARFAVLQFCKPVSAKEFLCNYLDLPVSSEMIQRPTLCKNCQCPPLSETPFRYKFVTDKPLSVTPSRRSPLQVCNGQALFRYT